jgi:hypothetical protein
MTRTVTRREKKVELCSEFFCLFGHWFCYFPRMF